MMKDNSSQSIRCVIFCMVLSYVSSLQLNQATTKPRTTKYSASTALPGSGSLLTPGNGAAVVAPPSGVSYYKVRDSGGVTCILLKTDALIEINFKSHIGDEQGDAYIPENASVNGTCEDDVGMMSVSWPGYVLQLNFAKTPGGERWYMDKITLTVSTDIPIYHNIRRYGKFMRLFHDKMLLPTPVGKSYNCKESVVQLTPSLDDTPPEDLRGTIYFRELQVQSFMYKSRGFGPIFECNAAKRFRDETAPIAVGSTLAIAVLGTITGYAVFRYLKVKKVQYNTME